MKKLILLIFVVAASLNAQAVQGQIGQVPVVAAADNSPVGGAGNLTTVGSVPYVSASGILNQDAGQFVWDATNNRLQIGPTAPTAALGVSSSTIYESGVAIQSAITSDIFGLRINSTAAGGKDWRLEQGRAATGALAFYQASSGAIPLTILSSGNVGIGTTTPVSKLDISDTSNANLPIVSIRNTSVNGYSPQLNFDTYGYSGTPAAMFSVLNVVASYAGAGGAAVSFNTRLQPQSTAVTAMTILGGGNVGIGTPTPSSLLTVGANNFTVDTLGRTAIAGYSTGAQLAIGGDPTALLGDVTIMRQGRDTDTGSNYIQSFGNNTANGRKLYLGGYSASFNPASGVVLTVDPANSRVGIGTTTPGSALSVNGRASANLFGSETNCSSSAGPAVCAAAAAGSVVVAAAASTVVVNSTAVTANSQIFVVYDSSLGTKLGVTCNATIPALYGVTARTAATSFTLTASAPVTNPACFSYFIVN